MDLIKVLSELRAERERVEQAIQILESLARGGGKRRGRPPKWMAQLKLEDAALLAPTKRPAKRVTPAAKTKGEIRGPKHV